jgi:hypothetical protein
METKRTEAKIMDLVWRQETPDIWRAGNYKIVKMGIRDFEIIGPGLHDGRTTLAQAKACAQVHAA